MSDERLYFWVNYSFKKTVEQYKQKLLNNDYNICPIRKEHL